MSPRILYKCWKLGIFLWILKIMAALKAQFKVHNLYTKSTLEQSLIQLTSVLARVFCLKHCLICWCQHLSIIYYLWTWYLFQESTSPTPRDPYLHLMSVIVAVFCLIILASCITIFLVWRRSVSPVISSFQFYLDNCVSHVLSDWVCTATVLSFMR